MEIEKDLKIAVLIPCYNEVTTIKKVVSDYKSLLPGARVLVFDNKDSREEFEAFVLSHEDIYDSIELDAHAERAIAHEKKQQWQIECCESMARLYQMYLRWEKEVTL